MSRIQIPASIEAAPSASQPLLQAVHKQLGVAPNLYRLIATSPAGLEGLLGLSGALAKGTLDGKTRERIALVVAELNGCGYCLAAHSYLGKHLAKLEEAEMLANREGGSNDRKAAAAVAFAASIVRSRGHVSEQELGAVQAAGYTDAQVIEIVLVVALNTLTNYVNNVTHTDLDFPAVR